MTRRILLAFAFVGFATNISALHYAGGMITYRQNTAGSFIFSLHIYRDCGGMSDGPNQLLRLYNYNTGAAVNIWTTLTSSTVIGNHCYQPSSGQNCGTTAENPAFEHLIYDSAPIALVGNPGLNSWYVLFLQCCFGSADNYMYFENRDMMPYVLLHTVNNNLGLPVPGNQRMDDSPQDNFNTWQVALVGDTTIIDLSMHDPDGDSLYYRLDPFWNCPLNVQALPDSCNSVSLKPGYAFDQPFPSNALDSLNSDVEFDQQSGMLRMRSVQQGTYAYTVSVESWRSGQKMSTMNRSLLLNIIPSSSTSDQSVPNLQLTSANGITGLTPVSGLIETYEVDAAVGDTISILIAATDSTQRAGGIYKNVSIDLAGTHVSGTLTNATLCKYPPCATLTSLNMNSLFTDSINSTALLQWVVDSSHVMEIGDFGPRRSIVAFEVNAHNDDCDKNGIARAHIRVILPLSPSPGPSSPPAPPPIPLPPGWNGVVPSVGLTTTTNPNFKVYPNPVGQGGFRLTAAEDLFNTEIVLVDILGRKLNSIRVDEHGKELEIDWTAALPEGVYFLILGGERTYKIIK